MAAVVALVVSAAAGPALAQGEEQAHRAMGRNYSGCVVNGRRSGSGSE